MGLLKVNSWSFAAADASLLGDRVDLDYLSLAEDTLAGLWGGWIGDGYVPRQNLGSRIPGYTGQGGDEIMGLTRSVLSAGATASRVLDGSIDRYYLALDGNVDSAMTGTAGAVAASATADVTWVMVIETAATLGTDGWMGSAEADGGERMGLYSTGDGRLRFQNKVSDNPPNSQDVTFSMEGIVVPATRQIIWASYDHSALGVAIGAGSSGVANVTDTWLNALVRGGTGIQFGAMVGTNPADGRIYAAYRLDGFYSDLVDETGADVFAPGLAQIAAIYGV